MSQERFEAGIDDNLLALYLDQAAQYPLLDAAQEVELAKTIEAGVVAEHLLAEGRIGRKNGSAPLHANQEELEWLAEDGRQAAHTFITSNLRLVASIAKKYYGANMSQLDLIQEGNIGLAKAVEKFDYTQGYKFSVYAKWWIRKAVLDGIGKQSRLVALPSDVVEQIGAMNRAQNDLRSQLAEEPSPDDIAAEMGVDLSRLANLMRWSQRHHSLDMPVGDNGRETLADVIGEPTASVEPAADYVTQSRVVELFDRLEQVNDRQAGVLRLRNGAETGRIYDRDEIASMYGVTPETIKSLERRAMQTLRAIAVKSVASAD